MPSDTDSLFRTLADPTRRQILDLLVEDGPLSVAELAAEFPDLVQSGISKHLMSLRAAGLVSAARHGRNQIYRLEAEAMVTELKPWLAKYELHWSSALQRLSDLAQGEEPTQKRRSRKGVRRRRRK